MICPRAKFDVFGESSKLSKSLFEISELQDGCLRPLRRLAHVTLFGFELFHDYSVSGRFGAAA